MTRTPQWLMFSLAATLALTGCGGPAAATGTAGAESVALQAVGYRADETEAGTEAAEPGVRPRLVRKLLRRDALHGEVVVQDRDDQMHTVVVQRGEVTAASADGFTVRSADGFALSWTYGDKARVVEQREETGRDVIRPGAKVGVGGIRDGETTKARLILVG